MIVGSSNLTLNALTKNREWNTKVISTEQGEFAEDLLTEFTELWNSQYAVEFENFIEEYELNYRIIKKQRKIARKAQIPSLEQYRLQPNSMQLSFISNLRKIREDGAKKALFLVHREQIAKQAVASYKKVFGDTRTFGLLSGNSKDFQVDYLFSTMQMMARQEILTKFPKDQFETIIIDEAHRTGAASYQKIMQYLTKFH